MSGIWLCPGFLYLVFVSFCFWPQTTQLATAIAVGSHAGKNRFIFGPCVFGRVDRWTCWRGGRFSFHLRGAAAPFEKKTDLFYSAPSRTRVYGRIKTHGKKNKRLRYRPADRPERSAWGRGCWRPACEHTLIILDAAPPARIRAVLSDDRRRPFRRTVRAKRWPAPTHTRVGRSENRRIPSVPALAIGLVRASPPEPRKRAKKKQNEIFDSRDP